MFALKKILTAIILPPFGLALIGLIGLLLLRRAPRCGRSLIGLSLVLLALLSHPWMALHLLRSLEHDIPVLETLTAHPQALVVLGGGTYAQAPEYAGQDTVNQWALARLRYAAYLHRQTDWPILVTGGSVFGERPEGHAMREALERDFNTPVQWVEDAARDTAENARYSAAILRQAGVHEIVLLSHAWHLKRAIPLFEAEGLRVTPAPTAFATQSPHSLENWLPSIHELQRSCLAIREWVGIAFAFGLHKPDNQGPAR